MYHHTKTKGDIAIAATIKDLTIKGFAVFISLSEHNRYDLIVDVGEKLLRLQSKYCADHSLSAKTSWSDKNGTHKKTYLRGDFDYYAAYFPDIDCVLYPSISFAGAKITTIVPNSATPFYWFEDFVTFTDVANKKTYKDFGVEITKEHMLGVPIYKTRRVVRPVKEELAILLWEKPISHLAKQFGVSGKAIEKWAKTYNICKPPRGYWTHKGRLP